MSHCDKFQQNSERERRQIFERRPQDNDVIQNGRASSKFVTLQKYFRPHITHIVSGYCLQAF